MYYHIALTLIPGIGPVLARNLVSYCGSAEAVFKTRRKKLLEIPGIGDVAATAIAGHQIFDQVDKEMQFIEQHHIRCFTYTEPDYPKRLHQCPDAPTVLFYQGTADVNAARIIGVVGTRRATPYGRRICEEIVQDLAGDDILVISGLAYGIDIAAHRACIKHQVPTIGVLAHGLDRIYPWAHRETAAKMREQGGLLTEFISGTNPDRQNFPRRNRIVAGMLDGLVVVETGADGGAVITALLADDYHRDVMAFPGSVHQMYSAGCHKLIKQHKATLVENADDIRTVMGWNLEKNDKGIQTTLFPELDPDEQKIFDILLQEKQVYVDELQSKSALSPGTLAGVLLNLEFKGALISLPGKMYALNR